MRASATELRYHGADNVYGAQLNGIAAATSKTFHKVFEQAFDTGVRCFEQHYLLYASSGCFNLEHGAQRWLLPPQRAALIAAGTEIRIWTSGAATSSSILFSDAALPGPDPACGVFACTALATEMIAHAMQWPSDDASNEAQDFFVALAGVCSRLAQTPSVTWLPRAASPEVARALDYTLENLQRDVSVDDVARAALLSRRTMARRFTEELGMSWLQYQKRARMIRAAELLARPKGSIAMVAEAVGFASASAFIENYKAFYNETPAQSRKRLAGK